MSGTISKKLTDKGSFLIYSDVLFFFLHHSNTNTIVMSAAAVEHNDVASHKL